MNHVSKRFYVGALLALFPASNFAQTNFIQTNLIANTEGAAAVVDPNMVGTWGISASSASPFWVSNTTNGTSTVFTISDGNPATLTTPTISATVVTIPASKMNAANRTGLPTGQVNNSYGVGNFEITPGAASNFIFASLDGTISARGGATAVIFVDNSEQGAVYTGLAIGVSSAGPTLYAANFSKGTIDTFDRTWKPITLSGGFVDPNLPSGYYPSNIQRYGRRLYVAYNLSDGTGSYAYRGPGTGLINAYDLNGNLVQRIVPINQYLDLPWGLAVTGANFGRFSYALLVGNFGDGKITAYDLNSGNYLGTMQDGRGNDISINGLWGLQWGNGGNGGSGSALYFAASPGAGPTGYSNRGLFGSLKPGPDAASLLQ